MSPSRAGLGTAALALAGILFGSTFLVVQRAVEEAEPTPFLGARFLIAAAVLAPFALRRRSSGRAEVRLGVVAGLFLSGGYLLQTFGLRSTTTSTSAFITYLLVVLVPVMVAGLERRRPEGRTVAGVGLAVAGLCLLSGSGGDPFDWGEVLTIGCAVGFAAHLVAVGRGAERFDPVRFTFVQVLTVGVTCAVPGALLGGFAMGAGAWGAAAFTGVFATAVAFFCMVAGQRTVPSSRAALILLVEPVSAGLLGAATGEDLGWRGLGGVALILGAILLVEIVPLLTGAVVDDPALEPTVHG
ncbi:MAG TPA: EamA family transporter [Acidimicrobiales bacterium]|nr:EamA family transporter [Acidimicrobiales bacterium]